MRWGNLSQKFGSVAIMIAEIKRAQATSNDIHCVDPVLEAHQNFLERHLIFTK
jgi:hypothetical protein